ncbi:hypothetical protein C8B47_10760 [filamentous cyanobacterium CCP4]|nr:hypothetical protein C8B47_10760 [filamentous cyanobacterium CCP4]
MDGITWGGIGLFFAYTLVTFLVSIVHRRNMETKGEEVKNESVAAVNKIAIDALNDVSEARAELAQMAKDLQAEREKRAYVEGQVEQLSTQSTQAKTRADNAQVQLALQDKQITKIYNDFQKMSDQFVTIKDRLSKVEAERDKLIREKSALHKELEEKGTAYEELMASIQDRIDNAVSDVRAELKQHYEDKILELDALISVKNDEIAQLKLQIQEETLNETSTPSNDSPNSDIPAPGSHADSSTGRPHTGSTTVPASPSRSDTGDDQPAGHTSD